MTHDSTGRLIPVPVESHSLAVAYNADGTVNTITATDPSGGGTYVLTYGYTGGSPTSISGWVKQ